MLVFIYSFIKEPLNTWCVPSMVLGNNELKKNKDLLNILEILKISLKTELLLFISMCLVPNHSIGPKICFGKYLLNECRVS